MNNTIFMLRKSKYLLGVIVAIIGIVLFKLPCLSLPYYWDEAYPYAVAVRTLEHNGLGLLPSSLPAELSKGHPLLFHFLAAGWMKIFGCSLLAGHLFALLLSVLLIITIYLFCSSFFSSRFGLVACLLFTTQVGFVAQSTFLLPEVLMSLWTVLCLFAWFKEKRILFVLTAFCMLLTKESGLVLIITLFLIETLKPVAIKNSNRRKTVSNLLSLLTPVTIASLFFFLQKFQRGWFFYPQHLSYISFDFQNISAKLTDILAYIFVYSGRNGLTVAVIISGIVVLINKSIHFSLKEKVFIIFSITFILFYSIFSAANFFIPRYLLCVLPEFIISALIVVDKIFYRVRYLFPILIVGLIATNLYFFTNHKKNEDLYCINVINVIQKTVHFCDLQNMQEHNIFTTCVLSYDFGYPYTGFVSGKPFREIHTDFSKNTEYCVFSSDENNQELINRLKLENKIVLVQRFEQNNAWCEVYKVER